MKRSVVWIGLMGWMLLSSNADAKETHKMAKPAKMSDAQLIRLAMTAGPADVAKNATIAVMNDDMKTMRELKKGTNGWVCMVMGPESMCADKIWQGWAQAYMSRTKPPRFSGVGIAYMLNGDQGVSNKDPFATAPTPDNDWIASPAHIMVLTSDTRLLDSLPTNPHNGGPWVMWKGTDYAHVMIPTVPMPKAKTARMK